MSKVSVIIPTYNRFEYLLNTLKSIENQTYKNIEIIVVNDGSTDNKYYNYNWNKIKIIHLKTNTKQLLGFNSVGYVINKGIEQFTGDYLAFCDDDDVWFPNKLELQINAMIESNTKMSCTEALIGEGKYNKNNNYKKYNSEYFYNTLQNVYNNYGSSLLKNGFPYIWSLNFIKIHNCIIASSVIIHKDIIKKIGNMLEIKMGGTLINNEIVHIDYNYWSKALEHTNCVYISKPSCYYDKNHGSGKQYST